MRTSRIQHAQRQQQHLVDISAHTTLYKKGDTH